MRRVQAVLGSLQPATPMAQITASEPRGDGAAGGCDGYPEVREPLKKVAALAQLLITNRARLDEEDRLLLEEMVASSRRLHWLIDTVAVYERILGIS